MKNTKPELAKILDLSTQTSNGSTILMPLRRKWNLLRWLIPALLVLLVIFYEIGPSRWMYQRFGFEKHLAAEIVLFGTIGPILAFLLIELIGRWIQEKETADLQAQLIAKASEKEAGIREVGDDTIQVLFATYLLLTTFSSKQSNLPQETVSQIKATERTLEKTIERLRSQLLT